MSIHTQNIMVLLSGGLDSTAALAILREEGHCCEALFVAYGQKAEAREREASRAIAEYFQVKWRELDLRWLGHLGTSALTETLRNLPMLEVADLDHAETVASSGRSVWVPNRNGVFAMAAAAIAEAEGFHAIALGFNAEEAQTFPDNSEVFLGVLNRTLEFSTRSGVRAEAPTVRWQKSKIVEAMHALKTTPFPWDLLWSCYQGGEIPCGRCESCCRLERALKQGSKGSE